MMWGEISLLIIPSHRGCGVVSYPSKVHTLVVLRIHTYIPSVWAGSTPRDVPCIPCSNTVYALGIYYMSTYHEYYL